MTKNKNYCRLFFPAAIVLLLLLAGVDVLCGDISFKAMIEGGMANDILMGIRLPRVLTAILVGGALGLAGSQMQAIFRNPLADPHIMGVSAGAGTGAAIATIILSGYVSVLGSLTIAGAAFIGAMVSSAIIIAVSSTTRNGNTLLLFGVMLGFIFSAITSILEYSASEESLKIFYSWSAGSFSSGRMGEIGILGIACILGLTLAHLNCKGLDIILFGDQYCELSGASVKRIRFMAMASCCLLTGAATAFCGPIGFIGIIAPHISRWITGTSVHRKIMPASALTGAIIALVADILSVAFGKPLPVGSTVAMIGIPVILVILLKKR